MKKTTIIEPILFGFMFCRYLFLAIEDQLIYKKSCLGTYNTSFCNTIHTNGSDLFTPYQNNLQKKTAEWKIYLNIARAVPAAFMTIIYATWSDHVGRKAVIILPIIGATISAMSLIVNSHFIKYPIYYMLIGELVASPFGNFVAILSSTFCYISDVTTHSFRTQRTIILESMVYIAAAIANLAGGQILYYLGFEYVYGLVLFMNILQIIYWMFVKESYKPQNQEGKKTLIEMFTLETFLNTFRFLTKNRRGNQRLTIWLLFSCFFFSVLCKFQIIFYSDSSSSTLYHLQLHYVEFAIIYTLCPNKFY